MSNVLELAFGRVQVFPTGAIFPENCTEQEFKPVFRKLRRLHTASNWVIGDAINFADGREWGKRYLEALRATDLEYKTLRNIASVCAAVELSRRRDNLSFGHHAEVAALAPAEQEKWLQLAAENGWPIAELRSQRRDDGATDSDEPDVDAGFVLTAVVAEAKRPTARISDFLDAHGSQDEEDEADFSRVALALWPLVQEQRGMIERFEARYAKYLRAAA